jgi:hypothetical protein
MPKTKKQDRTVALRELRGIAAEMKKIAGRMRAPRIRWAWNCPTRVRWSQPGMPLRLVGAYTNRAHTHVEPRNKGIICISPSWLLGNKERCWTNRSNWPSLIAHEMTHIRFPKKQHGTVLLRGKCIVLCMSINEDRKR